MDFIFNHLSGFGVYDWVLSVFQTDIAKMTVAFTLAAHLHRRWVRKDVSEQFLKITTAIDNVAATVSKDLTAHRERLGKIEDVVLKLDSRVTQLEVPKGD